MSDENQDEATQNDEPTAPPPADDDEAEGVGDDELEAEGKEDE